MQNIFTQGNGMGGRGFGPMNFRPVMTLGQGQTATDQGAAALQPTGTVPGAVPVTAGKVKPGPERDGVWRGGQRRDRKQWALNRLCKIMTRFSTSEVDPEVKSHIFWSYAKHSGTSEADFLQAYASICPSVAAPPKPTQPVKELKAESPEKKGFHGKTQISYAEAKELMLALDEVLKPLTPEESANELAKQDCLRDFSAGNFPIVEELRDDLFEFVAAGDTGATFEISQGQVTVAGKAIDCAVALGRGKAIKTAMTVGGIGAGAGLLWLLLL